MADAQDKAVCDIYKINNKPAYKAGAVRGDLYKDKELYAKYTKEVTDSTVKHLQNSVDKYYASQYPDQKLTVTSQDISNNQFKIVVTPNKSIKHADLSNQSILEMTIEFIRDKNGFVTGLKFVPDEMQQGEEFVKDFISHSK